MVETQDSRFLHVLEAMMERKSCMQDGRYYFNLYRLPLHKYFRCEVLTSNITSCPEPEASAFDHHEGTLDVTVTKKLYIRSDPQGTPKMVNENVQDIDFGQRGEYLLNFAAEDTAGNQAEELQL